MMIEPLANDGVGNKPLTLLLTVMTEHTPINADNS